MIERFFHTFIGGSARYRMNFANLALASAVGQIMSLAALPIITRLYSPQDFAVYALFVAALGIIMAVATGRFDWSLPNARNTTMAANIAALCLLCTLGTVIVFSALLFFVHDEMLNLTQIDPAQDHLLPLLALGIVLTAVQTVLQTWLIYLGKLGNLALSQLAHILVMTAANLLFGWLMGGGDWLVYSYLLGLTASLSVLIIGNREYLGLLKSVTMRRLKAAFARTRSQIAPSLSVSLINAFAFNLPVFLLASLFDVRAAGLYALASRISFAPVTFFTKSIASSFWAEASQLVKSDLLALRQFYLATLWRLFLIGVFVSMCLIVGSFFLEWIFGREDWSGIDAMVLAFVPTVFANVVFGPTNHLVVYRKQIWQLYADTLNFVLLGLIYWLVSTTTDQAWIAVLLGGFSFLFCNILRGYAHLKANTQALEKHKARTKSQAGAG